MTSKSIQLESHAITGGVPALFTAGSVLRRILSLFTRSELERARASYCLRRQHRERWQAGQNMLTDLPLHQKMQLGMHRWID